MYEFLHISAQKSPILLKKWHFFGGQGIHTIAYRSPGKLIAHPKKSNSTPMAAVSAIPTNLDIFKITILVTIIIIESVDSISRDGPDTL